MSGFEYDDDQGEELVPDEDWPTFFTMVPVWLLLCGCSAQAYRMYAFLAEHINQREPGKRIACPKQVAVARVLGLKDDRQVARYRQELAGLGALRVEEYRYNGGMRRGYRYVVRFNPPAGFEGLRSLQAFYEANPDVRSAKSEGRTKTAKTLEIPAQAGPQTGKSAAPADGAAAPGAAKPTKPKTGKRGNVALPPEVLQVLGAFPQPLRNAMKETAHTDSPKTLVTAVTKALQGRTAEQLVDRVSRRWWLHGYETKFGAGELNRPVGVAVAMLRHGECPDAGCEDGEVLATGEPCRQCIERGKDYRVERAATRKAQKEAAASARRRVMCPACERDRGTDGALCPGCTQAFEREIAEAADRTAADVAATPGLTPEQVAGARALVLSLAEQAREQACADGANDLAQLLAARIAAEGAARDANQARVASGSAPQDRVPIPTPALDLRSDREPEPCRGVKRDGSPCHRSTDAEDGLCGPCQGAQRAKAEDFATVC
ncbi:hypothetical protein [Kitasatospora sp. NPDC059160]|uniref:hypothetical protein n=1 Tax=Kitasatospora sp. NPDC059160 TaxID=3346748 RepID=UPI0036B4AA57